MTHPIRTLCQYHELDGKTLLICPGATKCATSWIYFYLSDLEGITVSPMKELHFFDRKFTGNALSDMDAIALKGLASHLGQPFDATEDLLQRPDFLANVDRVQMMYDDNAYFGHFSRLCTASTRTFCDITPAYSAIGPAGFAYMRDFCASQDIDLKLLFIMRDPIDRFWSQLRHMQQLSPKNEAVVIWPEAIQSPRICARADYRGVVTDLDTIFPEENVLYLFYEALFSEASLRRLCQFADVDYRPANTAEARNRTTVEIDLPGDARAAFEHLLKPQYAFCRERFGDAVPDKWLL